MSCESLELKMLILAQKANETKCPRKHCQQSPAIFIAVAVYCSFLFSHVEVSCFPKVLIFLNLRKYSTKDAVSPVSSVAFAEY